MKSASLLLLIPVFLLIQDPPASIDEVEKLLPRLVSLDPEERENARAELKKLVAKNEELKKSSKADVVMIALGHLGDSSVKGDLAKLVEGKEANLQIHGAEASAAIGSDQALKALTKMLESGPAEAAFPAARALARSKSKTLDGILSKYHASQDRSPAAMCRAIAAAYGMELKKKGEAAALIRAHLSSSDQAVREYAWIALANLPTGVEEVRRDVDKSGMGRGWEAKKIFLETQLRPEVRALLGNLLVRAGVFVYSDVLNFQTDANAGIAEWARRRSIEGGGWRRSILIEETLAKYSVYEKTDADKAAESVKSLIALYEKNLREVARVKFEGDTLEARVKSAKDWWEKNKAGVIDADVAKAVDLGVAWLKSTQKTDGSWNYCQCGSPYEKTDHTNGTTALALYTLVKMGETPSEKYLQTGVDYLLGIPLEKIPSAQTYTISIQAMLFAELIEHARGAKKGTGTQAENKNETARMMKRVKECADWLIAAQLNFKEGGYDLGPWTYQKSTGAKSSDNSNTQFAMLGLRAAQNVGVAVPANAWQKALNHWLRTQLEDGGWTYVKMETVKTTSAGTNSMSPAGMYCSLIALASLKRKAPAALMSEDSMRKVMGWLEKRYPLPKPARSLTLGHVFSVYYDLYSLERAMMISGTEKIGGKDWYHDGALYILWNQEHSGSWIDVTDTCFALLFLKRAFVPVVTGGDDK